MRSLKKNWLLWKNYGQRKKRMRKLSWTASKMKQKSVMNIHFSLALEMAFKFVLFYVSETF